MRLAIAVSAVVSVLALSRPARAGDANERRAEELFDEAMALVAAGRHAQACPRLERSLELDPGLGTQFNLADCYEHTGRRARAWAFFVEVATSAHAAGKQEREKLARERAAALEAILPKLTLRVGADAPGDLALQLDGVTLAKTAWRDARPIDPGEHIVEASAPGRATWRGRTSVGAEPKVTEVFIPALGPAFERSSSGPRADDPSGGMSGQRIAALAVGAGGVAATALGAVFGIAAINGHDDARTLCPDPSACASREGAEAWSDATSAGTRGTIAFIAAGVLIAGATVLWFTAPSRARSSSSASSSSGARGATTVFRF